MNIRYGLFSAKALEDKTAKLGNKWGKYGNTCACASDIQKKIAWTVG